MSIPPFIANSLESSPSMQPSDVLLHCIVATNCFNAKHKDLQGFSKAGEDTRDLINLLWPASMVKVSAAIYINSLHPHVLEWTKKLHTEKNSSSVQTLRSDSNVFATSNDTMSNLVSDVVFMKEYLENNQDTATKEKVKNKNKFTTMSPFTQLMILAVSTTYCRSGASSITLEFNLILKHL